VKLPARRREISFEIAHHVVRYFRVGLPNPKEWCFGTNVPLATSPLGTALCLDSGGDSDALASSAKLTCHGTV